MKRLFFIAALIVLGTWPVIPHRRARGANVPAVDSIQFKVGTDLGWALEDLKLAEHAIDLLIRLAQERKLEIRPYLTADRSRRLSLNFRTLVQAGKVNKNHAAFESQLTMNP